MSVEFALYVVYSAACLVAVVSGVCILLPLLVTIFANDPAPSIPSGLKGWMGGGLVGALCVAMVWLAYHTRAAIDLITAAAE